jgi:hypothetical protein
VIETHHPEVGKFACQLCNKPVNLNQDHCADENGKPVHENCYVQRLMSSTRSDPPGPQHTRQTLAKEIADLLTTASALSECCKQCSICGASMEHRATMFFFEGNTWHVPLAFCPKCIPVLEAPSYRA